MLISGILDNARLFIITIVLSVQLTKADNILAIFSYASGSPYLLVRPLIKELVDRGHQITVVSAAKYFPTIDGTRHIRVFELDHLIEDVIDFEYDANPMQTKWQHASWVSHFYYEASNYILTNEGVQQLLHNSSAQFDMVIMNTPISDALCGFSQHFNAPMVGIAAYGSTWIIDYLVGNSAPSIYEPMSPVGYTFSNSPSLFDMWNNWVYLTEEWLLERLVYLPPQLKLYRQYFDNSYSNFEEIRRNFSLILVNQHFSLGRVRSNVPNIIEVAGMHMCVHKNCKLDPIPDDLRRFMDEAEHGVIYFSMGVEIFMKWLPKHMKDTLFKTFSTLKQRVVWKYDNWQSFKNKSDNIYVSSFMPQQQILQHPKLKLFITHAGLLSVIETAYYGIPILSLPLYYDQFTNSQRMRMAGAGQTLHLNLINVEILNNSIQELIQNPSYARIAKQMSTRFRDQPMNPLETAVWWTEYTLRHKRSPPIRLAEHDMSFMQYYSVHFTSVLFGRIGLSAIIVILIGYKLAKYIIAHSHISLSIPLIR
ncbi:UDP-glycosyltransferase UGT5 isoform X1 [Drosophila willistoni]|uniref:UDP-glycosyltransferase UGT5 isoform X1 n=1 Tax=Drosophila willistoni TaxID=7260 RepID=UPI00017D9386|nr:UDP-glycosyltransferase UGT5 isoform X1 [Drosophila willistoni]